MEKKYQPQKWENKIYHLWEKNNAFAPSCSGAKKNYFAIIMPPPNANAPLHIGHALFATLQDIMIRFQRMRGKRTLWLPGADHAGILTQVVFEKHLKKQGKSLKEFERKAFYNECLKFTQKNKKIMFNQLKKIGASCYWQSSCFTLDKNISSQVILGFKKLFLKGLAYRGKRLINWCPRCQTALSDLELEYQTDNAKLWYIKYPLLGEKNKFLVVATTRPETMLGDTAIAVNPQDKRYKKLIGKYALIPLVKRKIKIISDSLVNPSFGSGAVKVTPSHDPTDWQIAQKHHLKQIQVISFDNKMTKKAGKNFASLSLSQAREKILKELKKENLLYKEENYQHQVAHCERCKTIIQPLPSKQWFIDMQKKFNIENKNLKKLLGVKKASLKDLGFLAVKKGLIEIIPKRFQKNYLQWLENLKDWCISRQIWWGQQLPIYYCGSQKLSSLQKQLNPHLAKLKTGCGKIIVSLKKPFVCPFCHQQNLIQDPDVFDTWFSSGQWAHNALGYPKSAYYPSFYPTSVLETGYEILNIWVTKMIILSLFITNNIPFKKVYLHGLVRDAFGEKMSKSKGNVINPLDVIEKYGADALRMALITGASAGNDISLQEEKIIAYRNFGNKIWNIGRFLVSNSPKDKNSLPSYSPSLANLKKEDKKIINSLNHLIEKTTWYLEQFNFSFASSGLYQFVWHELADKYLENVKQRIWQQDKTALAVLRCVFLNCLKLLHPFMPFVTETLWSQMPKKSNKLLILSSWPKKIN